MGNCRQARGGQRASIATIVLTFSLLVSSAGAVHDEGLLELDGDVADTISGLPYDWASLFDATGSQLITGAPLVLATFAQDYANPDPTYHGADKDIDDISQWECGIQSNPQDKTNILNGYAALFTDAGGDLALYFGLERESNNGNAFMGFWLLAGAASCTSVIGSETPFTGAHTTGDLLILSDFTGGGTISGVKVYSWDTTAPDNLALIYSQADCAVSAPADAVCGRVNAAPITTPWPPGDATPLDTNRFFEGGLSLAGIFGLGTPPCFATFVAETRSSQEVTAALKDYAMGSFVNCDARITISPPAGSSPVGSSEIFTMTVETDEGSGFTPAPGELAAASIIGGPGSFVGSDTCTTGGAGTCTVEVSSSVAGTTVVNAAVDVVVGSATLHRETDSTGSNSGPAEHTWVRLPSTTVTTPSPLSFALGGTVTDAATVSGSGGTPTGTVTYWVCDPAEVTAAGGTCAAGGTPAGVGVLSGGSTLSSAFTPGGAGTWCWRGEYSGDAEYDPSTDASPGECFIVDKAASAIVTTPTSATVTLGASVSDTALVTGNAAGGVPTGTVAFYVCGVDVVPCTSGGTPLGTNPVDAQGQAISNPFTASVVGTYCLRGEYGGNADYLASTDASTGECFDVVDATPGSQLDKAVRKVATGTTFSTLASAVPGDTIEFRLIYTNTGAGAATNVVVSDAVVPFSTFVSCTASCVTGGTTPGSSITWNLGTVAAGASVTVTFRVALTGAFAAGTTQILNLATVTTTEFGSLDSNTVIVTVIATPALGLVKSGPTAEIQRGAEFNFVIKYFNTGTAAATGALLKDNIPVDTAFVSCTGGCAVSGSLVTWNLGTVAKGTSAGSPAGSVVLRLRILDPVGCLVCNIARVTSPDQNGGASIFSNRVCVIIAPAARDGHAAGSGAAVSATTPFGGGLLLGSAASSQNGPGSEDDADEVVSVDLPNDGTILSAGALFATASSEVTDGPPVARQTSTAQVTQLNVLNGLVTADLARAVASLELGLAAASGSSDGSILVGVRVNGEPVEEITPGDHIDLPAEAFGEGSYVGFYDQVGYGATPFNRAAHLEVTMIHVHITDLSPLVAGNQPLELHIARAIAHVEFDDCRGND